MIGDLQLEKLPLLILKAEILNDLELFSVASSQLAV